MGPRVIRAERKVPGGKLVQMAAGSDGAIQLTGDFFLYPEDGLAGLEAFLSSLSDEEQDAAAGPIREYMERSGMRMLGLRPEDLADLLAEVRS